MTQQYKENILTVSSRTTQDDSCQKLWK